MYTHLKFLNRQVLTMRWIEEVLVQVSESVLSMKITDLKSLMSHDQYRPGMHFRKHFCWVSLCSMLSKTYLLEKKFGALKVWFC